MKSIKKISLFVALALFSFSFASAQVGIQAGFSSSNSDHFNLSLNGFHVGPTYNLAIQGPISLDYGLIYNYLGSKEDYAGVANSSLTAHRLDVPFRLNAGFPIGNAVKLYVFGGPNFNFGLVEAREGGFFGISGSIDNIYSIKDASGKGIYSRFDLQVGGGLGLEFGAIGLRGSYDLGLLDRDTRDAFSWKNDDLKLSLTYKF